MIPGLLDKITNILLGRVKGFMDFNLLQTPDKANVIAVECRTILNGWSDSFQVLYFKHNYKKMMFIKTVRSIYL